MSQRLLLSIAIALLWFPEAVADVQFQPASGATEAEAWARLEAVERALGARADSTQEVERTQFAITRSESPESRVVSSGIHGVPQQLFEARVNSNKDADAVATTLGQIAGFRGAESTKFRDVMSVAENKRVYIYSQTINGIEVVNSFELKIWVDNGSGKVVDADGGLVLDPGDLPTSMPFSAEEAAQIAIDSLEDTDARRRFSASASAKRSLLAYEFRDEEGLQLVWWVQLTDAKGKEVGPSYWVRADGSLQSTSNAYASATVCDATNTPLSDVATPCDRNPVQGSTFPKDRALRSDVMPNAVSRWHWPRCWTATRRATV